MEVAVDAGEHEFADSCSDGGHDERTAQNTGGRERVRDGRSVSGGAEIIARLWGNDMNDFSFSKN